jgi:hypothetical protein
VPAILAQNRQWAPKPLQSLFFAQFGNNAGNDAVAPSLTKTEVRTIC